MSNQTSLEKLGRRAVACEHWRWMPGMLAIVGTTSYRVLTKPDEVATAAKHEDDGSVTPSAFQVVKGMPDLSDPATLGCLLALVREAWPDEWHEFMVPIFDGISHWRVGCIQLESFPGARQVIVPVNQETMKPLAWAYSEAEALVIALEAAP